MLYEIETHILANSNCRQISKNAEMTGQTKTCTFLPWNGQCSKIAYYIDISYYYRYSIKLEVVEHHSQLQQFQKLERMPPLRTLKRKKIPRGWSIPLPSTINNWSNKEITVIWNAKISSADYYYNQGLKYQCRYWWISILLQTRLFCCLFHRYIGANDQFFFTFQVYLGQTI